MTRLKTTVCIIAICAGSGAMADVTAQQVWDRWQVNLRANPDITVTTKSEEASGGALVVTGMSVNMANAEEAYAINIGDVSFTEQDGGTVAVQMPESFEIEIQSSDADSVLIEINQSGQQMIVSGTPDAMAYDVAADRYALSVLEIIEGGESTLDGDIVITLNDLSGNHGVAVGDLREIDDRFDIGSVDLLVDVTEPVSADTVLLSGKITDLQIGGQTSVPHKVENPDNMFLDGFALAADYRFETANFVFEVSEQRENDTGSLGFGAGTSAVSMNKDDFSYNTNARDVTLNFQSTDMPFPVDLSLSEFSTGLAMPVSVTEDPADFALSLRLADAVVSDGIWAMGDPAGTLPRDPIMFDLALSGKTKLFFDLTDRAQEAARKMADAPGELHALNIDTLLLSAVGAMVTGSGGFTFDNDDYATFDGIPRPLGDATFEFTGANALIDNLVAMGLLPDDQASMGRLMMGMFARATGDDQLQTTVEVNDQGHLIVNGQRMR